MPFRPIESESIAEAAAAQIRELIAEDVLRPGDRLPSERELCEHMKVSRTSLREAVKALISEKLLESRRGAGLFVSTHVGADLASPLRSLIEAQPRAIDDYIVFRRMLEGECAAAAATTATKIERLRILRLLQQLEEAAKNHDQNTEAALDTEFHMAIVEAARNVVAIQVTRSLLDLLRRGIGYSRALIFDDAEARAKLLDQHRAIAQAIDARDAQKAREKMHVHLDFVLKMLQQKRKDAGAHALASRRAAWEKRA
ncbi:FadR/GntR family transcriptional regulator [Algihabitans albus]|uniref:FadR/GntR family transcriptional regulator n=1 Tax=Algihabitans albus TaxID=2164067 RepID=UPI0013C2C3D3|nr:FCD domain-containing protein [Algihabitans albus]